MADEPAIPAGNPEDEAEFFTLSAARREGAIAAAERVAADFGDRVVLVVLPDTAPLAPNCEVLSPDGEHLAMVSSNAAGTAVLVGPAQRIVMLDDDLDEDSRTAALAGILRGAIEQQLDAR